MDAVCQNLLAHVRRDIEQRSQEIVRLRQVEACLLQTLRASPDREVVETQRLLTQAAAAEQALRQIGFPAKTNDIVNGILQAGLCASRSDRKQFTNAVYSIMRRQSDTFELVERGVWGLREWQTVAATQKE